MAKKTKSTLTALFETGDTPDGSNYADLIDSQLNLANTTAQSVTGPVSFTTIGVTNVSATNLEVTSAVATNLTVTNATVSGAIGATTVSATNLEATSAAVTNLAVSGSASVTDDLTVTGTFRGAIPKGEIYTASTAAVSTATTFVNAFTDTTSNSQFLVDFQASANALYYKPAVSANSVFWAQGIVNAVSPSSAHTQAAILVNGSAEGKTITHNVILTSAREMAIHSMGFLYLVPEDYVSVGIRDPDASANYTVVNALLALRKS